MAILAAALFMTMPRDRFPIAPAAFPAIMFLVVLGIFGRAPLLTFWAVGLAAWGGQL